MHQLATPPTPTVRVVCPDCRTALASWELAVAQACTCPMCDAELELAVEVDADLLLGETRPRDAL